MVSAVSWGADGKRVSRESDMLSGRPSVQSREPQVQRSSVVSPSHVLDHTAVLRGRVLCFDLTATFLRELQRRTRHKPQPSPCQMSVSQPVDFSGHTQRHTSSSTRGSDAGSS